MDMGLALKLHAAMNRWTPYARGWRHGYGTKSECSRASAEAFFGTYRTTPKPEMTPEEVDSYMAGREAGARGDTAALLDNA